MENPTTNHSDVTPRDTHRPRMPIGLVSDERLSAEAVRVWAALDICEGWDRQPGVQVSLEDLAALVNSSLRAVGSELAALLELEYLTADGDRFHLKRSRLLEAVAS